MLNNDSLKKKALAIKEQKIKEGRPFVIEFTGTPESGKTTCIDHMIKVFNNYGLNVVKLREPAEYCPIPKDTLENLIKFNDWTFNEAVNCLKEAVQLKDTDVIICDRGIWDNLVWFKLYEAKGYINDDYKNIFRNEFIKNVLSILYILKTSPEESIRRRGGEGRVVTYEFVNEYNKFVDLTLKDYIDNIKNVEIINSEDFKDVESYKEYMLNRVIRDVHQNCFDNNLELVRKVTDSVYNQYKTKIRNTIADLEY